MYEHGIKISLFLTLGKLSMEDYFISDVRACNLAGKHQFFYTEIGVSGLLRNAGIRSRKNIIIFMFTAFLRRG
jgi:hypothetical protein